MSKDFITDILEKNLQVCLNSESFFVDFREVERESVQIVVEGMKSGFIGEWVFRNKVFPVRG